MSNDFIARLIAWGSFGLFFAIRNAYRAISHWRWQARAERLDHDDGRCVVCFAEERAPIGPNAYRCQRCGYEGGSGIGAVRERERSSR